MAEAKTKRLTAKGRKTATTKRPLHVCSQSPVVGILSKVDVDRRGRKEKQIWSGLHFPLPLGVPRPSRSFVPVFEEFERMKSIHNLNKKFFKLVHSQTDRVPPIMTFERWLCRAKREESEKKEKNTYLDPVLPSNNQLDPVLVAELERGCISTENASIIAQQLAEESQSLSKYIYNVHENKKGLRNTAYVRVIEHKHSFDICCGKKLLKVNHAHYTKLKDLFLHNGIPNEEKEAESAEKQIILFHDALFVLLARYHGIQGHGYQAACAEAFFQVLQKHFQVTMECFASPLNCYFNHYCTAFLDTDWCFGAVENFFNFFPKEGSFECNPPFVSSIMHSAAVHIESLLANATGSMTFVIVLPGWIDDPSIQLLDASCWQTAKYEISKEEHGFCDGAQHQRMDRFRESPFDTFIFILQNEEGSLRFPPSEICENEIRASMASGIPTETMKQRRLRDGRGYGHADGAGVVYKGKKKRKRKQTEGGDSPPLKRNKNT